jgi:hypothetical protein
MVRGSELATKGKSRGGLKFTRMDLEASAGDPALVDLGETVYARYLGTFIFEAEKEGSFSGAKTLTKEYPVSLLVDPTTGKVAGCAGGEAQAGLLTDSVRQEFCSMVGMSYNASTQKCGGGGAYGSGGGNAGGGYTQVSSGGSQGAFGSQGSPSSEQVSAAARALLGNANGAASGAGRSPASVGGTWDPAKGGRLPEPPSGDIRKVAPSTPQGPARLDGAE